MTDHKRHSFWVILLNIVFSLAILGNGIYVLIKKQSIIAGKYTGHHYYLGNTESIIIAISMLLISACIIINLSENKLYKQIAAWLLGIGIGLYLLSSLF